MKKSAHRDTNTACALAVVRFGQCPPMRGHKQTDRTDYNTLRRSQLVRSVITRHIQQHYNHCTRNSTDQSSPFTAMQALHEPQKPTGHTLQCISHNMPCNSDSKLQTFSSSNSSAVVYGLGHHRSRSRGKCIVNNVSRDIASLLLISPEIGYFSCTKLNDSMFAIHDINGTILYSITRLTHKADFV